MPHSMRASQGYSYPPIKRLSITCSSGGPPRDLGEAFRRPATRNGSVRGINGKKMSPVATLRGCEGENGRMKYFKINDYVTTTREYPYHHVFGHIPPGTQFTVAKYAQADETRDGDFVMVLKDRRMGWLEAKYLKIVQ
jgi:hypothetical protein